MIGVERKNVPVPDIFSSPLAEKEREKARGWFKESE